MQQPACWGLKRSVDAGSALGLGRTTASGNVENVVRKVRRTFFYTETIRNGTIALAGLCNEK